MTSLVASPHVIARAGKSGPRVSGAHGIERQRDAGAPVGDAMERGGGGQRGATACRPAHQHEEPLCHVRQACRSAGAEAPPPHRH